MKVAGTGLTLHGLSSPLKPSPYSHSLDTFVISGYTACALHYHPVAAYRFQARYLAKTGDICLLP